MIDDTPILTGDPGASYRAYADEIDTAVKAVFESGWYILGEHTKAFEAAFADWAGARHAIGVASGTDAICLSLRALKIGPGDEVITVSHTAVATVAAIEAVGATPVLADIDPSTYTLDPASAAALIGPRTKALLPVHLYGHPADITSLSKLATENQLSLIEDCAQAHGATIAGNRVGGLGDIGCFSFYPTKNLGAIGDGGAIVTSSSSIASDLSMIRQYGWDTPQHSILPGICSRLDEVQSAILAVKLKHLDAEIARRQQIAASYGEMLSDVPVERPAVAEGNTHGYHLYVIQTDARDKLKEALQKKGVMAGIHYPQPVHLQPTYKDRLKRGSLTVTEAIGPRILSLPLHPQMSDGDVVRVGDAVRRFFRGQP